MPPIPPDLRTPATYALATLHALAREEAAGRRPRRLLETDLATWRQFRGQLDHADLLELLLEDAAVSQPFAFDSAALLGAEASGIGKLGDARVADWISALGGLDTPNTPDRIDSEEPPDDYIAAQARRLDVPTRLARSELHRGIKAHHSVLELPGTGGQLAHFLTRQVEEIDLQDVFTIAWDGWADRTLAGLVAVEHGLTGSAPVCAERGIDGLVQANARFDYVIGALPERSGQDGFAPDPLQAAFPNATILLV